MGAVSRRVEADNLNPLIHEPRILSGRDVASRIDPAGEQIR